MIRTFPSEKQLHEFLNNSNWIEGVQDPKALEDSMEAWRYAVQMNRLSLKNIRDIHRRLMIRLDPTIAGVIRKVDVQVGGRICPNPGQLNRLMYQWIHEFPFNISNLQSDEIKEDVAKTEHIRFERIHPFEDGNGRTGRILLNWHRLHNDLPLLIIHEGSEQQDYYKWFKQ